MHRLSRLSRSTTAKIRIIGTSHCSFSSKVPDIGFYESRTKDTRDSEVNAGLDSARKWTRSRQPGRKAQFGSPTHYKSRTKDTRNSQINFDRDSARKWTRSRQPGRKAQFGSPTDKSSAIRSPDIRKYARDDRSEDRISATYRSFPPKRLDVTVVCLPGLEKMLAYELSCLDIDHEIGKGHVRLLDASKADLFACHLYLGSASAVRIQCGDGFMARGLAELRRKTGRLPWKQLLKRQVRFEIRVTASKSKLYHSTAIRERVSAGIYEALGYDVGEYSEEVFEPPIDENYETVRLDVELDHDHVNFFLRTQAKPLHDRGYRLQSAKAPLRADLAHALLLMAGWTPLYFLEGFEPEYASLIDPFCGSGTILIEAAAMAAGLPPGRLLNPPLLGTKFQNPSKWKQMLRARHREGVPAKRNRQILGSDRDLGAVTATKTNANHAGVLDLIDVQNAALAAQSYFEVPCSAPGKHIIIVTNPPYGKRLSKSKAGPEHEKSLYPLYQTLGEQVRKLREAGKHVRVALVVHDRSLGMQVQLGPPECEISTQHGGLPVRFMIT